MEQLNLKDELELLTTHRRLLVNIINELDCPVTALDEEREYKVYIRGVSDDIIAFAKYIRGTFIDFGEFSRSILGIPGETTSANLRGSYNVGNTILSDGLRVVGTHKNFRTWRIHPDDRVEFACRFIKHTGGSVYIPVWENSQIREYMKEKIARYDAL